MSSPEACDGATALIDAARAPSLQLPASTAARQATAGVFIAPNGTAMTDADYRRIGEAEAILFGAMYRGTALY